MLRFPATRGDRSWRSETPPHPCIRCEEPAGTLFLSTPKGGREKGESEKVSQTSSSHMCQSTINMYHVKLKMSKKRGDLSPLGPARRIIRFFKVALSDCVLLPDLRRPPLAHLCVFSWMPRIALPETWLLSTSCWTRQAIQQPSRSTNSRIAAKAFWPELP